MSTEFQTEERIEKCRKILEDNPRSQIFAALGDAYRKKGDLEKAYLITRRGLDLNPDYGPGHLIMAKIYLDKRLYPEAEKELEAAIKLDGKTRAAEKLGAEVCLKKGELDKAQDVLLRLREAGPPDESISMLLSLARNLKEKHLAQAREKHRPATGATGLLERFRMAEAGQPSGTTAASFETFSSWSQIVESLKSFPLVLGVLVIGPDGLVVESRGTSSVSPDLIGPLCLSIVETAVQNLPRLDFGRLAMVLVETATVKIWIWKVKTHYLVLWADPEVNLGSLKMRVSQIIGQISF